MCGWTLGGTATIRSRLTRPARDAGQALVHVLQENRPSCGPSQATRVGMDRRHAAGRARGSDYSLEIAGSR